MSLTNPITPNTDKSWVTGLFHSRDDAERAYKVAHERGYTRDDINLLMSEETKKTHFADGKGIVDDKNTKTLEGAGAGSAIGGTVGAVIAAIAAIGTSLALPGLGLVIAGPLAAAFAGAGAGGLTGGIIGALVGSGIPEDRAKHYDQGVREGGIVLGIQPRTPADAEYFESQWKGYGKHVYRLARSSSQYSCGARPPRSRVSRSRARSSTRRILPEIVLGKSPNSSRRTRW